MFEELQSQIFNGFLSADPEIKYFESGSSKTTFSIPLKNNKEDEAKWLNCEAWGEVGETVAENKKKGDQITIVGKFKVEAYNGKEYTKFNVSNILN